MTHRLAVYALALTFPLSGCAVAAVGAAGAVGVAAAKEQSIGESVDDVTTGTEIKGKLLTKSRRRFQEVDVEVVGGLVLLSGRVDAPEDRVEAEGIAWTSSRADDVANEIRIEPAGGFLANLSDEIISGRVRSRLIGSSSVKNLNFNIETYGGVVYLMGTARSAKELQRAAEEASVVGGVKQVVSYVRLLDAPRRAPAPISNGQTSPQSTYGTDELRGGVY